MSATLPSDGNGEVTWTDLVDNWRNADAAWLQERSLIRVASTLPSNPAEGRIFYKKDDKTLRLKNNSVTDQYATVFASSNIKLVDGSPNTQIITSGGDGITIKNATGSVSMSNGMAISVNDRADVDSPYQGLMIYETTTGSFLVYYGATTGWRLPWNQPWGPVGSADLGGLDATNKSNTGAPADISSLFSTSITFIPNRRYRVTLTLNITAASLSIVNLYFTNGTGSYFAAAFPPQSILASSSNNYSASAEFVWGGPGITTYTMRPRYSVTGGAVNFICPTSNPNGYPYYSAFYVSDIGPAIGSTPPSA